MATKTKLSSADVGVIGFGEVGKAIAKFYKNPKIKDLKKDDGLNGVEVLHICTPYLKDFFNTAKKEIKEIGPKLTIIHSTVAPGTTRKLAEIFGGMVTHSPIRGVHPYLHEGIKTFVKYIGADSKKAADAAERHLMGLGLKTKVFMPSAATELGKLFDTTYYGICIAWHAVMKEICDKFGVNFENAATDFNLSYNDGYPKLGKKNVVRPVLTPPNGGIGGHCVIPNVKILKSFHKSKVLDFLLEYDPINFKK